MFRRWTLFTAVSLLYLTVQAQDDDVTPEKPDTVRFALSTPAMKVSHSLYRRMQFIDSRVDTSNLGIIAANAAFDKVVMPARPLGEQFSQLLHDMTDSTARDVELLLQLKRFSFFDLPTRFSHKGCSFIRAFLYVRSENSYQKLAVLDTLLEINYGTIFKSSLRKRLFAASDSIFCRFIYNSLRLETGNTDYLGMDDIRDIDEIEKKSIPLYKLDSLPDGIYKDFAAFSSARPSYPEFIAPMDGENVLEVLANTPAERNKNLEHDDLYAFVRHGKIYLSTSYGYYPLVKKGTDFFYIGKIKVSGTNFASAGLFMIWTISQLAVGMPIAVAFWNTSVKKTFLMKLDYLDGAFIPVAQKKKGDTTIP
ncbi:hypothetical protein Q4E93_31385 [Flavitalea sp. BT771]|uniref:hypothetical protein n=1 Tax=Flavitalea sp. BT771 TaxID=3063329 RepID=UPI0026E2004C|nr:hypothetical protein [Flavitalea sp. BT771]MDO6435161.1 hypothetical protein [Flavitalea sp. BT771]MDV6224134.1 hypothetical protein [Flavitalea sp. BT771]